MQRQHIFHSAYQGRCSSLPTLTLAQHLHTPCSSLRLHAASSFFMDSGFQLQKSYGLLSSLVPKIKYEQISPILLYTFLIAFPRLEIIFTPTVSSKAPKSRKHTVQCLWLHLCQPGCFLILCYSYPMTFRILWCTYSPVRHCRDRL